MSWFSMWSDFFLFECCFLFNVFFFVQLSQTVSVLKEAVQKPTKEHEMDTIGMWMVAQKPRVEQETNMDGMGAVAVGLPVEEVCANPVPAKLPKHLDPLTSVTSFTVGSLQQYTNSFGQENLIGVGSLGSVYQAECPDGQVQSS